MALLVKKVRAHSCERARFFKASLSHCFGRGLTGFFYCDRCFFAALLRVFDGDLGALFRAVVGRRTGVAPHLP